MNRTVSADEARKLLDETDGPPTVFSHLSHIDGSAAISVITSVATAKIDKARISSVNELREALASVLERESATDAWLAEIGHLSLAAAGVELAHLRGVEKERDRLRDILAAERGDRAPEGWTWDATYGIWRHEGGCCYVSRPSHTGWYWHADTAGSGTAPTALEAIEAADRAAGEVKS